MITIPKKVEYSVEMISYFAQRKGEMVSLLEVARSIGLPYRFLGQIAIDLKKGEIIESREGKNGGYSLKDGWGEKTMLDLVKILRLDRGLVKCLGVGGKCARAEKCRMKKMWTRLENSFLKELGEIKLNEV